MLERQKVLPPFTQVLTSTKKEVKLQLVVTYGKNVLQLQYWFQGTKWLESRQPAP